MDLDVQAQRAEGVSPLPPSALMGSVGKDANGSAVGDGSNLPTTSMDEERLGGPPGAHVNRGVEMNTNPSGPSTTGPIVVDLVTAGELPVAGTPFDTPDASQRISTDRSHTDWDDGPWKAPDQSGPNERAIDLGQLSTFGMIGETPQGEGDAGGD